MVVTSLVENTSITGLSTEHGLSLHILLGNGRQILFDMGQYRLFLENANKIGINISNVDTAVVSHGHYDHGGGLQAFLEENHKAKVFLNNHAFEPHFSLREEGLKYIGLSKDLETNERVVFCGTEQEIEKGVTLFAGVDTSLFYPRGNRLLYGPTENINDDFRHEQSMVIEEGDNTVLFAGCAHAGIVNITNRAEKVIGKHITHVFAGMHLVKSGLKETDEQNFIHTLADKLMEYKNCQYVTMHCTGIGQYEMLKEKMGDAITYMSCGDIIKI